MSKGVLYDGQWFYALPEKTTDRHDIIVRMIFAPMETDIWGIKDGQFFHENNKIEGIEEGITFEFVTGEEFFCAVDAAIEVGRENEWTQWTEEIILARDKIKEEFYKGEEVIQNR